MADSAAVGWSSEATAASCGDGADKRVRGVEAGKEGEPFGHSVVGDGRRKLGLTKERDATSTYVVDREMCSIASPLSAYGGQALISECSWVNGIVSDEDGARLLSSKDEL